MTSRALQNTRYVLVLAILAAAGVLAAGYVLLHERLAPPLSSSYDVRVELTAANGVVPGLGQPVEVAGVGVGSITGAHVGDGTALVTMQIERSQLAHVYANASATLAPITPLDDMQLLLNPGGPPAKPLSENATIPIGSTTAPVPLSDLTASLDSDTRDWLGSLLTSLGQGTGGQAADLRRGLLALAPTAEQLHSITSELAARRTSMARLVHNLAIVTRAASQDRQLSSVVVAGDETLKAVATQDVPLSRALELLPGTLADARSTLSGAAAFSNVLAPAVTRLLPAVKRLPGTLRTLQPFAGLLATTLRDDVRPLIDRAEPTIRALGPATNGLVGVVPHLTSDLQVLQYATNELAYDPGGDDPGFLYWLDWWSSNGLSVFSSADAHGMLGRASVYVSCQQLDTLGALEPLFTLAMGVGGVCPS